MLGENVIHAHLSCVIIVIQDQRMGIASLLEAMSGKSTCKIDSTQCHDIAIFCSGSIYVNHNNEE
jgi:hypothetical protein